MSVSFWVRTSFCVIMQIRNQFSRCVALVIIVREVLAADDEYNVLNRDGSYEFGYNNPDSYHYAKANRKNVVKGQFGGRNPETGAIDSTIYTAGPRGYRPRGKNVVRKYDLNQAGPRPIGSRDDPYYDPYEDPSYNFAFKTRTYTRNENANRLGDVKGKYSYVDDVGEKHNVEFIAGKNTGFHVKTPFPDSNPKAYGPLYFRGRGKPIPRGRTSIQRGLDGSYKFVSAGPDQRRTETSDSTGHVRGSYTYLDDKGVQHSVHYIAGPETGYRVLKQVKGPHLPTVFPFEHPGIIPSDFYDYDRDVFDTAASGHVKPSRRPGAKDEVNGVDEDEDDFGSGSKKPVGGKPSKNKPAYSDDFEFGSKKPFSGRPSSKPSYDDEDDDHLGDIFGDGSTGSKPGGSFKPSITSGEDDGSYKPSGENGAYIPPSPSSTSRPSDKPTPRPIGDSFEESYDKPSSTSRPNTGFAGGYGGNRKPFTGDKPPEDSSESGYGGGGKPPAGFGGADGDFGLFGSESNHPRPPYGGPSLSVTKENCHKCTGTIVTNVGDRVFSVPPGVSIRAHVQAIDLLPFNPNVLSPSEQFKADLVLKTEQLNAGEDGIVGRNDTYTTTEESTTQILATTISPTNTTST